MLYQKLILYNMEEIQDVYNWTGNNAEAKALFCKKTAISELHSSWESTMIPAKHKSNRLVLSWPAQLLSTPTTHNNWDYICEGKQIMKS
jgi:hypothetical protein